MNWDTLANLADSVIIALPFVGFYWLNESFEIVVAAYLGIIALYAMRIEKNLHD